MSHAIQTYAGNADDALFGRSYAPRGEVTPEFRLPAGWWLLPAVIGGAAGWFSLITAVFF